METALAFLVLLVLCVFLEACAPYPDTFDPDDPGESPF